MPTLLLPILPAACPPQDRFGQGVVTSQATSLGSLLGSRRRDFAWGICELPAILMPCFKAALLAVRTASAWFAYLLWTRTVTCTCPSAMCTFTKPSQCPTPTTRCPGG